MDVALTYSDHVHEISDHEATYLSALFPSCKEFVFARFGKWDEILNLNNNRSEGVNRPPYIAAMQLYPVILAKANSKQAVDAVELTALLQRLTNIVQSIPEQEFVQKSNPFYPYHRQVTPAYCHHHLSLYSY